GRSRRRSAPRHGTFLPADQAREAARSLSGELRGRDGSGRVGEFSASKIAPDAPGFRFRTGIPWRFSEARTLEPVRSIQWIRLSQPAYTFSCRTKLLNLSRRGLRQPPNSSRQSK